MTSNPLTALIQQGQSPWIDFIRRTFMTSGAFGTLIDAGEIQGATSNPSIFEKAIGGSDDYDDQLRGLVAQGISDPKKIFDELAIVDIQMAADLLRPVYERTRSQDGYISLEVSPGAANDTARTLDEARYLWGRVGRPNVMIKVPGTAEGIPAVQQLLSEGINVNITLLFAPAVYALVTEAFLAGLEQRAASGKPIDHVASVASFFVSRVDTEVDQHLEALAASDAAHADAIRALQGQAAVANAKLAYEIFQRVFGSDRFAALKLRGAQVQRCLWASTSTKNPHYRDVLYVEELIGPDTVNTMPPATIDAFRDHGQVAPTLARDLAGAHATLAQIEHFGVSMADVTQQLEIDGVKLFADAYDQLMDETTKKIAALRQQTTGDGGFPLGQEMAGAVTATLASLDQQRVGERLWSKDPSLWKSDRETGLKIMNRLGWLDIARVMESVLGEITGFADDARRSGFTHAVLLGMGGSSLCPEVLRETFGKRDGYPELHVLDSTDPATLRATEQQLDLAHTLFIVASKSGTTLETLSHFAYFYDRVRGIVGERDAGGSFVAITDPGTPLEAMASRFAFRAVFRNPPDIGGRYSALSYFGLVPGALAGVDVGQLLDAALAMTQACGAEVPAAQNPGIALGAVLGTAARAGRDKVTLVASPAIGTVGLWIEQLIAESTGKEGRGLLPVAGEPLGTPAVYGPDRIFAYLRLTESADPAQDAAMAQLAAAGHPVVQIDLRDRYALGGEFYRWEVATAIVGALLGINAFDEPNVQESKDNTKRILAEYKQDGRLPNPPTAALAGGLSLATAGATASALHGAPDLATALAGLLRLGRPGDYLAIMAYLEPTQANDDLLQRFRARLRDQSHLATTLGFGPRFLHSTGQLHKGGPNTGIFIQIVADDRDDVRIPNEYYTFGTLIHAQSLGDFQSLQAHERRVIRLNLGGDIRGGLQRLAAI